MNASRVLTPSQLAALARSLLEDSFALVEVEGELSNVSRPASGHLYFSIKDRAAQIRCAMFRPKSTWLKFRPADGDQVLLRGRVTLYEPRGDFQIVVEHIEPAGEGALRRAFEEIKRRLEAEGLFDAARKRPIPRWIGRLGVLSSPGGAAIHDVLSVLRRRFPLVEVELLPVSVQGSGAAAEIVAMLRKADASGRYDALLLTRGGGSLEDLMAFNDEALARAIAGCTTPLVSAVGHEVDFSIADFVADLRAPTPSAAAETLVPDRVELRARVAQLGERLARPLRWRVERLAQRLDQLSVRLAQQRPQARLGRDRQRLDALRQRIALQQRAQLTQRLQRLRGQRDRLAAQAPRRQLERLRQRCADHQLRLRSGVVRRLERLSLRLNSLSRTLAAVGPRATLERGYAVLRDAQGRVVGRCRDAAPSQRLRATLADGSLDLSVTAVNPRTNDSR